MTRRILHLDLDAFFCAVEENRHPDLKGKAFAVGGRAGERGVIASCSYAARQFGVHSAMPTSRALRLCPQLIVIPGSHHVYGEMSRRVMARLSEITPLVEPISIDEAFIDITGLADEPAEIGRRLQTSILNELGLPCSIGIASSKLVAKIATEVGKKSATAAAYPRALTIVPPGEEAGFLAPLPAEMLWGVGPKTSALLAAVGIRTIGDIASWPEAALTQMLGEYGRDLARHARGQDDRPISTEREPKSMSQETTFARDITDDRELARTLRRLAADVARYLRRANLAGSTVRLKIRWPDFTTHTRQITLTHRTDDEKEIARLALDLMKAVRRPGQPVRLLGVGVSGLGYPVRQLNLWEADSERSRRLMTAVDELRERYGDHVIRRGEP
jgi:DNA polymerase IV